MWCAMDPASASRRSVPSRPARSAAAVTLSRPAHSHARLRAGARPGASEDEEVGLADPCVPSQPGQLAAQRGRLPVLLDDAVLTVAGKSPHADASFEVRGAQNAVLEWAAEPLAGHLGWRGAL